MSLTSCRRCPSLVRWTLVQRRCRHDLPPRNSHSLNLPPPRYDVRRIAENVVFKSHNAFNRNAPMPAGTVQAVERLYNQFRELDNQLNAARATHNALIKRVKDADEANRAALIDDARKLKKEIHELENTASKVDAELNAHTSLVPNDTHPDVPIGKEAAAVVVETHGPDPLPADVLRDHVSIGRALDILDTDSAALSTGTSWYYLTNEGALLELALINYALDVATSHGFAPVLPPDVVRADIAHRCGFAPRDTEAEVTQMYHLAKPADGLVLAGTAEIPLAALFANRTLEAKALPHRVAAVGRAFRAEAGARGADTRGLYRVHQFSKVELFAVTSGAHANSEKMLQEMLAVQIGLFKGLGLTFRVLDMPTEELGAAAYRKYDIEAWMPGRGKWGEISSTSNCTDFQARRLHIRHTPELDPTASQVERPRSQPFAHTLNGTAAAIPRLMVALLENGVRFDDNGKLRLALPKVLQRFWIGGDRNVPEWLQWA